MTIKPLPILFLSVSMVATASQEKGIAECDALWQEISADTGLLSPSEKAKAMQERGKECMNDTTSIVRLANFYIEGKQFDRAEALIISARKQQPSSPELEDRAAFIALSKGDLPLAEIMATQLISKYPNLASPYVTLASIATQRKKWDEALRFGRKAYELTGDSLILLSLVGDLHQLGHHEDAVNTAYRALKENPSLIGHSAGIDEAIYSLGALGRFDEAAQLAKRRMAADQKWQQDSAFVQAAKRLKVID